MAVSRLARVSGLAVALIQHSHSQWARGVRVYVKTATGRWQQHVRVDKAFCDEATLFELVKKLVSDMPLPAIEIGVTCYLLTSETEAQLSLFDDADKVAALTAAIDEINGFYGAHTVHSADTLGLANRMKRKISFGSTRYL